jgi:hypothetical protein
MEFCENLHMGMYHMGQQMANSCFLQLILLTPNLLLQIHMKLLPIWSYVMQIMVMVDEICCGSELIIFLAI